MRLLTSWLVWGALWSGAMAAEKDIMVRYAAQAAPPKLGKLVMTTEEVRSDPFALPLNHLSEPQKAPGRVFRLVSEKKAVPLATVTLPELGEAFILLLIPGVKSPFEVIVIPDRDTSFRPGDYYVHNISKTSVIGKVGDTQFVIPSRRGEVVRPKGAREERFYDVVLGVQDGGKARVISTSRWPLATQMRTYVFFFDNPQRKDVDFRAIDEFVPPKEE